MGKAKGKTSKKRVGIRPNINETNSSTTLKSENQFSSVFAGQEANSPYQILNNLSDEARQKLRLAVARQLVSEMKGNNAVKKGVSKSLLKVYKPEDFYEALCFIPGSLVAEHVANEMNGRLEKLGPRRILFYLVQASAKRHVAKNITRFRKLVEVLEHSFVGEAQKLEDR